MYLIDDTEEFAKFVSAVDNYSMARLIKKYGEERTNTIVIARKEYVGHDERRYVASSIHGGEKYRSFEAHSRDAAYDRRGEGTDAQEVARFHLPNTDPCDVFVIRNLFQLPT